MTDYLQNNIKELKRVRRFRRNDFDLKGFNQSSANRNVNESSTCSMPKSRESQGTEEFFWTPMGKDEKDSIVHYTQRELDQLYGSDLAKHARMHQTTWYR